MKKGILYFFLFFAALSMVSCKGQKRAQSSKNSSYKPPPVVVRKNKPDRKSPAVVSRPQSSPSRTTAPPKVYVPQKVETNEGAPKIEKKAERVTRMEHDFLHGAHKAAGRSFTLKAYDLPVPGESLRLKGYTCRPADGYQGYYEAEKVKKDRIVLHFTVGNVQSDIHTLTKPRAGYTKYRSSVAFVMARDGTIYQLFSSAHWSNHLGKNAVGGNTEMSKSSIAIELSNYGPLIKNGDKLETVYSNQRGNKEDIYCTLDDTHLYMKLDKPYRGYQYFATFTDEQYDSLIILLRYLTAKYQIPRKFLPERIRYEACPEAAHHKGITSHVNYRVSGKWDIGPAFDWDRVIEGLDAATYTPNTPLATQR